MLIPNQIKLKQYAAMMRASNICVQVVGATDAFIVGRLVFYVVQHQSKGSDVLQQECIKQLAPSHHHRRNTYDCKLDQAATPLRPLAI
jgi:hypothetical protein